MKTLFIAIFTICTTVTFAQETIIWKGGTPGKETSWNEARNWNTYKVPNEFSDVFIPDVSTTSFSKPVIKEGTVEVNSITIESTGHLTIEHSAMLVIYEYTEGLIKENIKIEGSIFMMTEHGATALGDIDTLDFVRD